MKQFDRFHKTYGPVIIEEAGRRVKPYEYKPTGLSSKEQEIIKQQVEAQE